MYATSYVVMALALAFIGQRYDVIHAAYPESIVEGALKEASTVFSKLAARIIQEQSLVIGPLAWIEAKKVPGLSVDPQKDEVMVSAEDGKGTIDRLVAQYERLFGRASEEVCREAVASLIASMPRAEVPASLLA